MSAPVVAAGYRRPVEFRIGAVLTETWTILSRHFLTFLILLGLIELPVLLARLHWNLDGIGALRSALVLELQMIPTTCAEALVAFAAFQELRGRPVNAAESIRRILPRFLPVLIAASLNTFLLLLGLICCFIPGLVASTVLAVTVPVCLMEHLGPIRSMNRSAQLTHGHRGPILSLNVAAITLQLLLTIALQRAFGQRTLPTQLLTWTSEVLWGTYWSVWVVTLYHHLRSVKEGLGVDEIASVFD
jgi:hypothetical protein